MTNAKPHKRGAVILFVALGAHVGLFGLWRATERSPSSQLVEEAEIEPTNTQLAVVEVAMLPAQEDRIFGAIPPELAGAVDQSGEHQEESFRDRHSTPGQKLGRRAPGELGAPSFVPRRDRDSRSSSLWNSRASSQMQNSSNEAKGRTTPESLEKRNAPSFSQSRVDRDLRRRGADHWQAGHREGTGKGGLPGATGSEWLSADPLFDSAPLASTKKSDGVASPKTEAPLVDIGAASTENSQRGVATSQASASARSTQASPSIFTIGAPSRGDGDKLGSRGVTGNSIAAHFGDGTAAQAGSGKGSALAATRASKSIPYFFEMYRQIDKELRFPKELALALEQGDLVLRFTLNREGEITTIRLSKRSGFVQFDKEALRAFQKAAPYGAIPKSLMAGRDTLSVIAPYYFRNRLIR